MKIGNLKIYGIIYKITNIINKVYIGQTVSEKGFNGRYRQGGIGIERVYKYHLKMKNKNNKSYNSHLYNSINKYGLNAFQVTEIFDIAFSKEELDIKEDMWINYYDCIKYGYNRKTGGANGRLSDKSKFKISKSKIGKNTGKDNSFSKKVVCLNTGKVFDTGRDAVKYYNLSSYGNLSSCCSGKYNYTGTDPKTNNGLVWRYYDDYIRMSNEEITYILDKMINLKNIRDKTILDDGDIVCVTTNIVFKSVIQAMKHYGIETDKISSCCKGKRKTCGSILINNEEIKLEWEYYKNYISKY
jgi:hypothetical protein